MNPFDTDPQMFALRIAYGTGVGTGGFAVASLITGTPMPSMFVQSMVRAYSSAVRAKNAALFAFKFAPQILLVGSAVAQRAVWEEIGDSKTGAVHFAAAGTMSGGSMPVVLSQDTSDPMGGFDLQSIWSLF
jgi:hypothetical protein